MGLATPDREECLARLVAHRRYLMRQLGILLKTISAMAYLQQDGVRSAFGLPPVADPHGSAQGLL
jgi:hypothetical protein